MHTSRGERPAIGRQRVLAFLLGTLMAFPGCSSAPKEPKWRVVATTLAFGGLVAPEITFAPDGELLLGFPDGSLRTLNPSGNPNDPSAFRLFEPSTPPNTSGLVRSETSSLWTVEVQGTATAPKAINYRLRRGSKTWERIEGDPEATNTTRIFEVSNGTFYAVCAYPPEVPHHGVRSCFKKLDGPWQHGDRIAGASEVSTAFNFWLGTFDDHRGGLVAGDEHVLSRNFEGVITTVEPTFTHNPKVTPAAIGLAGITREGNYLFGSSNYGGAEPWVYEIRPDGYGRSWVDQGCVRIEPYMGPECQNGRFDQVWATQLPILSPSGAAYQIWRIQNGDSGGVLMRARPNGTKWEVLGDGNPFQDQNPLLYISPTGKLYNLTTGLSVSGGGGNGYYGVGNTGLYVMDEPELP